MKFHNFYRFFIVIIISIIILGITINLIAFNNEFNSIDKSNGYLVSAYNSSKISYIVMIIFYCISFIVSLWALIYSQEEVVVYNGNIRTYNKIKWNCNVYYAYIILSYIQIIWSAINYVIMRLTFNTKITSAFFIGYCLPAFIIWLIYSLPITIYYKKRRAHFMCDNNENVSVTMITKVVDESINNFNKLDKSLKVFEASLEPNDVNVLTTSSEKNKAHLLLEEIKIEADKTLNDLVQGKSALIRMMTLVENVEKLKSIILVGEETIDSLCDATISLKKLVVSKFNWSLETDLAVADYNEKYKACIIINDRFQALCANA